MLIDYLVLLLSTSLPSGRSLQRGFIKLSKHTIISMLIASIALVSSGLIYMYAPSKTKPAEAAWFNDNWSYRKALTLTGSGAESNKYATLSSYDASDTSKYQSDCGDVRFTSQDGALLPYTVTSCGASTTFHINLTSILDGTQTIYLHYRNPSVVDGFASADLLAGYRRSHREGNCHICVAVGRQHRTSVLE
jgi:hypothetical protein